MNEINVYCDADWGSDVNDRKSTSGFAIFIGRAFIAWNSKKQNCVSLSTMEAEYVAMSEAIKEETHIKQVLDEVGIKNVITNVYCDNQAAISQVQQPKHYSRAKHIDIRYHFIRDTLSQRETKLSYVRSDNNIADILTKVLSKDKFARHKQALGVIHLPTSGSVN